MARYRTHLLMCFDRSGNDRGVVRPIHVMPDHGAEAAAVVASILEH